MKNPLSALRTPSAVIRLLFALLTGGVLVLGYLGMRAHLSSHTEFTRSPWDLLYYTLQLFVLDPTPIDGTSAIPPMLQFARFAAPVVTIYALVETTRLLLSAEIQRIRARRSRRHAVVCGDGPAAHALTARLHGAGHRVVAVTGAPPPAPGRGRILTVTGDARDPEVLRAAGAHRADVVYACETDGSANTGIVLAAQGLERSASEPLRAYALIPDLDLCTALRARRLGMPDPPGLRLDFFNLDQLAARVLLDRHPLRTSSPVVLVGLDDFGRALVIELARHWRLRVPHEQRPLPVTVVDPRADSVLPALLRRYAFVGAHLELRGAGLEELERIPAEPPQRVYVCHHDENLALRTALTSVRLWTREPGSLVVRVEQGVFDDAFRGPGLLDDLGGALHVFAVTDEAVDPQLIAEDLVEQLARAVHEDYAYERLKKGDTPDINASLAPWEELPASLRNANLTQAADIGRKLRSIGCLLAPRIGPDSAFSFREEEIDRLAVMEHERWMRERREDGWTHGPARDDAGRRHPDLQDWSRLPESSREKDRATVRNLPAVLATAGFQIVRVSGDHARGTAPPGRERRCGGHSG
ncbi:RyR domain-containing protein [Planomonospora sp. ID82291]|uniref:RyR domain-containing protein n=1 Tax=Planomonospora sp. ID82291 TaxID=2738136 RepID=UPI0018C40062|nr:RyR domain-containing protein [Planomonospora sp. ID82291]MBG0817570.1 NAD-binding protein [Planomonospora sp. ID82291]